MCDYFAKKDFVAEFLGCSHNKAYQVIREINEEIEANGKKTFKGKVNLKRLAEKIDVDEKTIFDSYKEWKEER